MWLCGIVLRIVFVTNTPDFVYVPVLDSSNEFIQNFDQNGETYENYLSKINQSGEHKSSRIDHVLDSIYESDGIYRNYYAQVFPNIWSRPYKSPKNFLHEKHSVYFFAMDPDYVSSWLKRKSSNMTRCFNTHRYKIIS